jgi:hypothetical protein
MEGQDACQVSGTVPATRGRPRLSLAARPGQGAYMGVIHSPHGISAKAHGIRAGCTIRGRGNGG